MVLNNSNGKEKNETIFSTLKINYNYFLNLFILIGG